MVAISTPERSRWAVRALAIDPSDHVLEIGCGRGVALSLVCDQLVDGRITAIDRSAAMVRIAAQRSHRSVVTGKATLRAVSLEDFDPGPERFNKIFAVNVSMFWLRPASAEVDLIRRLLVPGGLFYLFYEQPGTARAAQIAKRLAAVLGEKGFTATAAITQDRASRSRLSVVARPH